MTLLESKIDSRSPEFQANAAQLRAAVEDLQTQMAQVAPCAAGNVQHSAVGSDQVAPAPHPFRGGLCTVRNVHTVHETIKMIAACA